MEGDSIGTEECQWDNDNLDFLLESIGNDLSSKPRIRYSRILNFVDPILSVDQLIPHFFSESNGVCFLRTINYGYRGSQIRVIHFGMIFHINVSL